jgi:S-adenosylmethionine:tRNA ribosyltransferase-isomerase
LLVSAFMGEKLAKTAYKEAISQKYRFFSYGDAMLIL